ncbi:MAG: DUF2812 domain-containing protein [Huintestinicola sp.]
MTIKNYPVWFLDIIKTEKRLTEYHEKGLALKDFRPIGGKFVFEDAEPAHRHYRICRAPRCGGQMPQSLASKGWEQVCGTKNSYVVRGDDSAAEKMPSYSSWTGLFRIVQMILFLILCYLTGLILGSAGALFDTSDGVLELDAIKIMHHFTLPAICIIAVILLWIKIHLSNRKMTKAGGVDLNLKLTIPKENYIYTKEQEKQMLKSGEMMKKSPLGWFYAPDKAEEMVERLAAEGWKFYRFNELGTQFFFVRSEPCRLKFVVDYQNHADDQYFVINREDGWKLEFTSVTRVTSYCVWSREYDENEECPVFYSDHESNLKRARSMMLTITIPFLLIAVVFILMAFMAVTEENATFAAFAAAFYAVIVVEYGFFAFKTIGYYLRMRKLNSD